MRTRCSPRLQLALWRQLGREGCSAPAAPIVSAIPTDAEIEAMPISRAAKAAERRTAQRARVRRAAGLA